MISIQYLRQFRIGQFTIFDTVLAYIGMLLLAPILTWLMSKLHIKVPLISWIWFTMPLSVIFHVIFRQITPLIKLLADPMQIQFYIAFIVLVFMVYMGSLNISKIS